MTDAQIAKVAAAIDAVQLFSRYNDWSSDRVPGYPVEICRNGGYGEPEVVVIERFPGDVQESAALYLCVSRARAIAAIKAIQE